MVKRWLSVRVPGALKTPYFGISLGHDCSH